MKNKYLFLILIFFTGIVMLAADYMLILYFGHSHSDFFIRFTIPALVFFIVYCGVLGRNVKFFDDSFFKALSWKELAKGLKKIGSVPIRSIGLGVMLHTLFLGGIFFSSSYLNLESGTTGLLYLVSASFGIVIGTFVYVMGDNLVSRALLANKITQYPRKFRAKRQSLKALIIPVVVCFQTILFTCGVTILSIREAGGTLSGMTGKAFFVILIPLLIFFLFTSALGYNLKRNSSELFTSVIVELENLSSEKKDLTRRVSVCSVDELGTIAGMVNDFSRNLGSGIRNIKEGQGELTNVGTKLEEDSTTMAASITQISGAAQQILVRTQDQKKSTDHSFKVIEDITKHIKILEKSIDTQVTSMNQASSAVEQMVGNISSIGTVTEKMAAQFKTVETAAEEGGRIQKESGDLIHEIVGQSKGLQDTNKIISTIAAKTNLLAMNAAIEAAHAGEAGRGFSVVADEIRKLAESSASESQKISTDLKQIVNTINKIVQDVESSGSAFAEVSNLIRTTNKLVVEVDSAIREQKTGAGQILESLRIMNGLTTQVGSGYRELSHNSETMLGQIKTLEDSAGEIFVSMEEVSGVIKTINTGAQEVSGLAVTTKNSIEKISSIADEFEI